MFKFRILELFEILYRNMVVWSGYALTPALTSPTPICFLAPYLSRVPNGLGFMYMKTLVHMSKVNHPSRGTHGSKLYPQKCGWGEVAYVSPKVELGPIRQRFPGF